MHFDRKILLTERSMLSPPPPLKSLYRQYTARLRGKPTVCLNPSSPFQSKHGMAFYPDKVWPKLQFFCWFKELVKSHSQGGISMEQGHCQVLLSFRTLSSNCEIENRKLCVHD